MIERLPKHFWWYAMPNEMIEYCVYACGKMSVNGVSTIFGLVRQVMKI